MAYLRWATEGVGCTWRTVLAVEEGKEDGSNTDTLALENCPIFSAGRGTGGGGGGMVRAYFGEAKFGEGKFLVQNLKYNGKMWHNFSK